MELRDIEYFTVVAQHGSVRRASEVLDLSPPALSKSLRRLENAVGAKLVRRTSKGVELTAVGTALVAQARRIRMTMSDVLREAADLSHGQAGHLRIGASPAIGEDLPSIYAPLLKQSPKLTLEVVTSDNDVTLPLLLNGELDLIFNYLDFIPAAAHETLTREHLYDDIHVVCASARHRLANLKRVTPSDLVLEGWALSSPKLLNVNKLSQAFRDRGLPPPKVVVEARSLRIRLQTWASTDLLGYVPRRVLRQAGLLFRLKELPIRELEWRRPIGIIYRKDAYLSPAAKRFIEILKATGKEIVKKP
jgi:DNA-binding transcriptional LysR family regulator